MRKQTGPEQIASLMVEDYGSNLGQDPTVHAGRMPSDQPSVTRVVDAVGGDRHTEMRQCSAQSCANNIRGRSCGLAAIEIGQNGGCSSYEQRDDDCCCDDEEVPSSDEETILGISALMPNEVDVPSRRGAVAGFFGGFNPGTPT